MPSDHLVEWLAGLPAAQREQLERELIGDGQACAADKPPQRARTRAPATSAQQRLWFLSQLDPQSAEYVIFVGLTLRGPLDVGALGAAVREIVARHGALRSRLVAEGREVVQIVEEECTVSIPCDDLSALPPGVRWTRARELALEHARTPFDLGRPPLLRVRLLDLGDSHVLLLAVHHICFDAWSMGIFFRELSSLYSAFAQGGRPDLPPPRLQYADYAAVQHERLHGAAGEHRAAGEHGAGGEHGAAGELVKHWRRHLAKAPLVLDIPADHVRPARRSGRGRTVEFSLPSSLVAELTRFAQRADATRYAVLLAAFQALLARYAEVEDVLVATTVAGRQTPEAEEMIGLCMNVVVLRARVTDEMTFLDLVGSARQAVLDALEYQDAPFEQVVEALQLERDPSRAPLAQVAFELKADLVAPPQFPRIEAEPFDLDQVSSPYDLALSFARAADGLTGVLVYDEALFRTARIERFAAYFTTLLQSALADPRAPLSALELLPEDERRMIVAERSRAGDYSAATACVHDVIAERARATPSASAVLDAAGSLTYCELDLRSARLASVLLEHGAGEETVVAVLAERNADLLVALLAVLRAGAAYLPLDPEYPLERMALTIEDARPVAILAHETLMARLPPQGAAIPLGGDYADAPRRQLPSLQPSNAACVMYTSGSTGPQKGVIVEHGSLAHQVQALTAQLAIREDDVLLAVTPPWCALAALELFGPLVAGGTVAFATAGEARDPGQLCQRLGEVGATVMQATPSSWRGLVQLGWHPSRRPFTALCGGEALPPDLAHALAGVADRAWNLYGPAEATAHTTAKPLRPGEAVTIGRPLGGTRAHVLDRRLRPAPAGVPGELFLGGPQVARGYLRQPGQTAERFVPDPFAAAGARLYRTGDLARFGSGGDLEYLGRTGGQLQVRGHRIEAAEVEAALTSHQEVGAAVVVADGGGPDSDSMLAYVVAAPHLTVDTAELHASLRGRLPDYMLPAAIHVLEQLPLTGNGKLDRRAVAGLGLARGKPDGVVAQRTPVEEVVFEIWEELLGLEPDQIGASDSFFELGGHSLLAMQVIFRLREIFEVDLPATAIFDSPRVADLAAAVEEEVAREIAGQTNAEVQVKLAAGNDQ